MTKDLFRSLVKWLGVLLMVHLAAMILFGIIVAPTTGELAQHGESLSEAYRIVWGFGLVLWTCFSIGATVFESTFAEYRTELKQLVREKESGVFSHFFRTHGKECIGRIAMIGLIQLPFLIFFACFDFSLVIITGFEEFYILDAGAYAVTQIPILGWLLNLLLFGGIWFTVYFIGYLFNYKRIKKELSDLH